MFILKNEPSWQMSTWTQSYFMDTKKSEDGACFINSKRRKKVGFLKVRVCTRVDCVCVCMCPGMRLPQPEWVWGGQRTIFRTWFSPSTSVWGIKLRSSNSYPLSHWAGPKTPFKFYWQCWIQTKGLGLVIRALHSWTPFLGPVEMFWSFNHEMRGHY